MTAPDRPGDRDQQQAAEVLEPGDFVEIHLGIWPEGVTLRGPLTRQHGALTLGSYTIVRFDGEPGPWLDGPGSTLVTCEEQLRQRLQADGRLWKLAYAEGEAAARAEARGDDGVIRCQGCQAIHDGVR